MNTIEKFKNKTQYLRWCEYYEFFMNIKEMQGCGRTIWVEDGEDCRILGKIKFEYDYENNEIHIVERFSENSRVVWVGYTHDFNKKTNKYDFLHIDDSLKKLKKDCKFKYYENEVYI